MEENYLAANLGENMLVCLGNSESIKDRYPIVYGRLQLGLLDKDPDEFIVYVYIYSLRKDGSDPKLVENRKDMILREYWKTFRGPFYFTEENQDRLSVLMEIKEGKLLSRETAKTLRTSTT